MFGGWEDNGQDSSWMSYTDLMTGLLIIFIITALSLSLLKTDEDVIASKYEELVDDFSVLFEDNPTISIADSASIRFTIGDKAFDENEHKPTEAFREVLDKFIPAYYRQLQDIYENGRDSFVIQEIRIEGHTDSVGEYINNLVISSARALEIQKYIVRHPFFKDSLDSNFKAFALRNSIPVGYAYTRPLNLQGETITNMQKEGYSPEKSRRVEFRVLIDYLEK
ncbi:OmpA/MotB family protein [Lewinella cohaerens]|uniref:OmpA/MotB family protein n=1 Tax=Lewinella cohaerens TaxID=70995 RepID=UPI00037C8DC9|nr:OmpA family protein [Lewinella cohaerens]